jgi:hypothetical protein
MGVYEVADVVLCCRAGDDDVWDVSGVDQLSWALGLDEWGGPRWKK